MSDPSLVKIQRLAGLLRILAILGIVLVCLAVGLGLALGTLPEGLAKLAGVAPDEVSGLQLALVAAAGALPAAAAIWTLLQAEGLFRRYAGGEILTGATARGIKRIGAGLLAIAILGVVARPLQSVLASAANPPGERVLALSVGSPDYGLLLAGGLMTVIGWIMAEAARIADDNKGFV